MKRAEQAQRGAALISVLWLSVALTLIASTMLTQQRDQLQLSAGQQQQLQQRYNLHAAEQWLRYQLLDSATASQLERSFAFNGHDFQLSAIPEDFHINLNSVESDALQQLLAGLGLPPVQQRRVTDHILDWRDEDQLSRLDGAEQAQYDAMGQAVAPANRPFLDLTELNAIPLITPGLYAQLSPWLSLHSRATRLHPDLQKKLPRSGDDTVERRRRPPVSNRWRLQISNRQQLTLTSVVNRLAIAQSTPFTTLSWQLQSNPPPLSGVQQPTPFKER